MHVEHGKYGKYGLWTNGDNWRLFNVVLIHVQSSVWLLLILTYSYFPLLVPCLVWTSICILSCLPTPVLMRLLTFVWLHSLLPCLCTLLPSLALDIGWTHIWSPLTRLQVPICWTISHTIRAPLFVLMPTGLVSTCPLVFPWFNKTKCVTLAYMSLRHLHHIIGQLPGPMSIVQDGSDTAVNGTVPTYCHDPFPELSLDHLSDLA